MSDSSPVIVVGVDEESFLSLRRTRDDFLIIVIPFLFSIIILAFQAIKIRLKRQASALSHQK